MKNIQDNSWQIPKKISKKSKKWKIFFYIFLWWFFIFTSLVFADYYFFYQENKKYFSDQKAGFELIWDNLKNNLEQKNFFEVEKNLWDLEKKFSKFEKNFLEKISDKKFLIWSEKIFFKWKNIFENWIILWRNFLEINKNLWEIFNRNWKKNINPVENILKLNEENLEILSKIVPGGFWKIILSKIIEKKYSELIAPGGDFIGGGVIDIFKEVSENKDFISQIFWKNSPQTSVVFFQNSNESRATWWFVWSFLIFTANNWKILDWKIHDIYEFDGQLKWNFEKIPFEAKSLVWDENWSLRDFNANPDLKISSRNFNYFFEKSWWKTVDNFFYLDSKILWEILKITWPIKLKNLWIEVNENNWDFVFQYFVESKKNFEKIWISPKKLMIWEIILSLKNKILEDLKNKKFDNLEKFLALKNKILEKKYNANCEARECSYGYLKLYSKNEKIEKLFKKNILEKNKNLEKYFISISWNKSDKFIENKWINWKENFSEKIISVKRKFFKSEKEKKDFEEFFEFLYKKFWSDIPKNELKKILWFWENNSILQFYTQKNNWENLDLLFVKYIWDWSDEKISLNFKKWQQGEKNVFEINLPILKSWEKQEIFFNWKKK